MIWSNNAYDVEVDDIIQDYIYGRVVKTIHPNVYDVGDKVIFPVYNVVDKNQQMFFPLRELKLNRILK